jgi:signal transduction histidine kinase
VDNLLEWSRSQQSTASFRPEELDLFTIVDGTCRVLEAMANQKEIRMDNLVESGTTVYADERMLETILRNLISNAIKFTPEGGSITIRSQLLDDGVEVSVTDTGVGIEESALSKLFAIDSAYRTSGTDGERGSGLGLDICREFVHRHDGHLRVESTVGLGSTFRFTLPPS